MGKISILEKQVAELIAAGEVVERPASIVKELVENAIDAGASSITVEIRGGGIRYIRITDNGCGIERDDVPRAFIRHATSKVKYSDDLNNIITMGFRGEALASIAAMAKVELLSRTAQELAGTRCVVNGGEQEPPEDAGCPVGTIITVQDVFYNTPARMKFLKKDVTEGNSVQAVVEKAALAEPGIAFRFLRDGVVKLTTPGDGKLLSVIRCIFGREFSDKVLAVNYSYEGLTVKGLICKPEIARASRSMQNFFINRRFVRSKTCMVALEESYKNAIMIGKYPSAILNLTIPPQIVDVNVHPAKTEVRFSNEKDIFNLVYYACKTTLNKANLMPEMEIPEKRFNPFQVAVPTQTPKQEKIDTAAFHSIFNMPKESVVHRAEKMQCDINIQPIDTTSKDAQEMVLHSPQYAYSLSSHSVEPASQLPPVHIGREDASLSHKPEPTESFPVSPDVVVPQSCKVNDVYSNSRVVGELFSTFIVLENNDEAIFVDKHAAHERLLYNQLIRQGMEASRQILLTPLTIALPSEEYSVIVENIALLQEAGLGLEDFGDGCVLVREVAPVLENIDIETIVTEFAQKLLRGNERLVSAQLEHFYHIVACRAAVKAGDSMKLPSLEQLISLLQEDADSAHCPHGRPVAVRMSKHSFEKKFGRLG